MNLKKNLLALSVGTVIAAASTAANANSLLFPFFTTNNGGQSSLSLTTDGSTGTERDIHFVYNYGASCTHFDLIGKMTGNDLLQQSIASPAAGGYGLAAGGDKSTPAYFPLANQEGFLVVSDTTSTSTTAISGDMAIADPSTGLVAAYSGITNGMDTSATGSEGDFSNLTQQNFGLSFYPQAAVTTSWYTVVTGNMNAAITNGRDWTGTATLSNNGKVYDNDENAFSGTMSKTITCAGTVAPTDLMNTAQQAAVGPNGGLLNATWTPDGTSAPAANGVTPVDTSTGVVMFKMQLVSASVGAPFAGKMFLNEQK